ncbi:cell division protein SepF [Bacillaceae bacterium]
MGVMNKIMGFLGLEDEQEEEFELTDSEEKEAAPSSRWRSRNNVVSLHHAKEQTRLILMEPKAYDEAQEIADHLRNRRAVVINLQRLHPEQAKRIVDFLSGTVYALNGDIQKVGPNIFICTPDNVDVQGTISEMFYHEEGKI